MTNPLLPALVYPDLRAVLAAVKAFWDTQFVGDYCPVCRAPTFESFHGDDCIYSQVEAALVSEAPREDGLAAIIADLEEALAVESTRRHGICGECGVDHDNEARLDRAVIALTLRRLRKLSASRTPTTTTAEE